jgi:O-antigen chain-terminating methyltransferase
MADSRPPVPAPIPLPDRTQIERLNTLYDLKAIAPRGGWRGVADRLRALVAPLLARQQEFNAAVVEHLNRNAVVAIDAHEASARTIDWVEQTTRGMQNEVSAALDDVRRYQQALAAREIRSEQAVRSLAAAHDELRTSLGVLHQAAQNLKRELVRLGQSGVAVATAPAGSSPPVLPATTDALDSHKYVGFEDQFRGSQDDIRARVSEYLPIFKDATDVLDVGCGRGEFLALLREHGVRARGIDVNATMVEVCRQQGLDAVEADALTYLRAQPDDSFGGLFAAQVIEHLEPRYLAGLLDAAFEKLRPGAPIVLETINPACWFAFFESYIRDVTHVRPIHPDTLKYLLVATGFQNVDIRYRAPYPQHEKLQPLSADATLGDAVDTLNANVEKINRLLFTYLDYAAIAHRP